MPITTTKTRQVADKNITYAKVQDISAANIILGRYTSGAGVAQELLIGAGLSISGSSLIANISGTTGKLAKFTSSGAIGDSIVSESGTEIRIIGVGSYLAFDTTGLASSSTIKTVEDFKLSIHNNRGTTTEIKVGNEDIEFLTNTVLRARYTQDGQYITNGATDTGEAHIFGGSVRTNGSLVVANTGANYSAINTGAFSNFGLPAVTNVNLAIGVSGAGSLGSIIQSRDNVSPWYLSLNPFGGQIITANATDTGEHFIIGGSARVNGALTVTGAVTGSSTAQFTSLGLSTTPSATRNLNIVKTITSDATNYSIYNDLIIATTPQTASRDYFGQRNIITGQITSTDAGTFNPSYYTNYGNIFLSNASLKTANAWVYYADSQISTSGGTVTSATNYRGSLSISNGTVSDARGFSNGITVSGGSLTDAYAHLSTINQSSTGSITTGYLYYGSYSGTIGTKWGLYLSGETNNYLSGNLLVGSTTSTGEKLQVTGTAKITSTLTLNGASSYAPLTIRNTSAGAYAEGINLDINDTTTGSAIGIDFNTSNADLGAVAGARIQGVRVASAAVTDLVFSVRNSTPTLNEAFRLSALSGTNTASVTGNLTVSGTVIGSSTAQFTRIGLGTTPASTSYILSNVNPTGATNFNAWRGIFSIQSDITSRFNGVNIALGTQATTFTISDLVAYNAETTTIGAGSTITRMTGYNVDSTFVGATNVYGFFGGIPSGTGRWNLYMNGTAVNYINGNVQIGSTTATAGAEKLQVTGSASISSTLLVGGVVTLSATGQSLLIGTGNVANYINFAQTRGFSGYDGVDMVVQGALGKGIKFNVNNNTFGSGTAMSISSAGILTINLAPTTSAGGFDLITRNTSTGVLEKVASNYYALSGAISGTTGYIPKFTASGAIGDSVIRENGGNIGINVNPVNAKLEVVATTGEVFRADAAGGAYRIIADQSGVLLGGNVGIGTASPASILEISQATPIFRIQASDTGSFHGIEFRQGAGFDAFIKQLPSTGEFRISNGRSVGWGGTTTFYTDTIERMRITSTGLVGIGAASPSSYSFNDPAFLVVANTSGNSTLSIVSSTTGIGYLAFADGTTGTDRYSGSIFYSHSTDTMSFKTAGSDRLEISSTGAATFSSSVTAGGQVTSTNVASAFRLLSGSDTLFSIGYIGGTIIDRLATTNFFIAENGSPQLTIATGGAATFSSSVTAGGYITSGGRTTSFGFRLPDWQIYNTSGGALAFNNYTTDFLTIASGGSATFSQSVTAGGSVGVGGTNTDSLLTINGTAGTSHERFREGSTTVGFVGGADGIITGHAGKLALRGEAGLVLSGQGNAADFVISNTGAATFSSTLKVNSIANATTDTDKFLVSDGGDIKYRTGAELLSDIGAAAASGSANYIQNQSASAQTASMWITGDIKTNGKVYIGTNGAYIEEVAIDGVYELRVVDSAGNTTVIS